MSNISYRPILEDTVWSYSRIGSFNDCSYRFFLKYIKGYKETDMFYASYGSFIHKLLEKFYRGELTQEEMLTEFMTGFSSQVKGARPKKSTVEKYIEDGCNYLREFVPLPFETVAVEKEIRFKINGYNFVGYIDHLGTSDGKYYITDNKSRNLKKRSGRTPPTQKDIELDKMLRQLYLYSIGVKEEYGAFPEALCFNCFRSGVFIKEKFDIQKFEEAKQWAVESIEKILDTGDFEPNQDYFMCNYICGVHKYCEYNDMVREYRRFR